MLNSIHLWDLKQSRGLLSPKSMRKAMDDGPREARDVPGGGQNSKRM